MSIRDSQANIKSAAKTFFLQWQQLKATWRDENRNVFEKKYIEPLQNELTKADLAMERMDKLLLSIRQHCE